MNSPLTTAFLDPPRLERLRAARVAGIGTLVAIIGVAMSIAAAIADPTRFGYAYLVGFLFVTTIALGGLFFVLIQHVTRAGWSVAPRRQMEWLASALPVSAVLFVPLAFLAPRVWGAWMAPENAHDALLAHKAPYLNAPFFFIRAALYLGVWTGLSLVFTRLSLAQDESGDRMITDRLQRGSAPALVLFALTVTFAAFDWLMSLDPHWFSTIFGVYVFAGCVTSSLAVLALATIVLQKTGLFRRVSSVEHRHDIGKLLFAFTVFWAYIAFSQYFLIWYANIPEETIFYRHRLEGGWKMVSLLLVLGHFAIPFLLLLSRAAKRGALALGLGAALLLVMHYVDLYWVAMPVLDPHGPHLSLVDLAGLLGPLGVAVAWVARRVARDRLYPVGDPRLHEAVRLENA